MPEMFLSVIIPAYNEEARLATTLSATAHFFDEQFPGKYEILVVDDGSVDQTAEVARAFSRRHPNVHVLEYGGNRGKGFAVRYGMLHARGEWRLFCDADLATPVEEFELLFARLNKDGSDIAIGSRPLPQSHLVVHQPWYRERLGRMFNKVVQLLAVKGISDTQCGFKIFSDRSATEIFSRCKIDGFIFDAEALFLARKLGYGISEVPIRWSHKSGSKVSMFRDGTRMIADLITIRSLHRGLRQSPMVQSRTHP